MKNKEIAHDASLLGGAKKHLGEENPSLYAYLGETLVPPVITMTLYFIIFGNLIGSRIGDMHGFSYMQFIVPGLIMMSGDYQCLRQRCVIIFWCQVPA